MSVALVLFGRKPATAAADDAPQQRRFLLWPLAIEAMVSLKLRHRLARPHSLMLGRPCRILDWGDDPPEYHPCVRNIPVSDVLDAARRVMR